ncbi:MAG: aldo/keto reductase [Candidatus Gastranaerophilales bacterium]|nr:aldo/keto reductase [Candidatus Gastranaerophilales bacterium]
MKRRDFLKNCSVALTGSLLLSGCKNSEQNEEGQITRRKFKNISMPLLGLGCMRLPMKNNQIDMDELNTMVDYCIQHGANYFDTAYRYVDYKSEIAIGKALSRYNRKDFLLADKSPLRFLKAEKDIDRIFQEQLRKCQVDYFDFYMAHNINVNTYDKFKQFDMYNELLKYKKDGKIKYMGFSFHGSTEMLKELIDEHKWDFCMLQMNYLDWNVVKAKEQYELVEKAKIPVIVMEPLRGGGLVKLPEEALQKLHSEEPDTTPANFGLRWVASRKNVITVLSGMSNINQVKENINTFTNYKVMTEEEEQTAEEIAKIIQSQGEINCTACKYCTEVCPKGINIPAIFALYNQYKITNDKRFFLIYYNSLAESEKASNCIKCGVCNSNCPQSLNIPELLAKINEEVVQG